MPRLTLAFSEMPIAISRIIEGKQVKGVENGENGGRILPEMYVVTAWEARAFGAFHTDAAQK